MDRTSPPGVTDLSTHPPSAKDASERLLSDQKPNTPDVLNSGFHLSKEQFREIYGPDAADTFVANNFN